MDQWILFTLFTAYVFMISIWFFIRIYGRILLIAGANVSEKLSSWFIKRLNFILFRHFSYGENSVISIVINLISVIERRIPRFQIGF